MLIIEAGKEMRFKSKVSWAEFKRRIREGTKDKERGFLNTLNDVVEVDKDKCLWEEWAVNGHLDKQSSEFLKWPYREKEPKNDKMIEPKYKYLQCSCGRRFGNNVEEVEKSLKHLQENMSHLITPKRREA